MTRRAFERSAALAPPAGGRGVPSVKIAVVGMLLVAGVVIVLGIAHVGRRQEVIRLGYELSRVTDRLIRAQEENRRLRLEKSTLTSPERIQRLARSLGMVQPDPSQIRVAAPRPDAAPPPPEAP